jgi:putative ABC transport system permease protein
VFRSTVIEAQRGGPLQLLNVVGKLRARRTIEHARAEIATIQARVRQDHPGYPGNRMTIEIVGLAHELSSGARPALVVLFAAVVFVLVIACANVASLLLGRGSARQKEIAIRAAVGAGRGRLVRLLMIESLMLALAGGAAGLLLARWTLSLIVALGPHALPRLIESTIDLPVLLFTLAASIFTALAFGMGPAFAIGAVPLSGALNVGGPSTCPAPMNRRTGRLLVALEMALAVVLLTGAGLLIKSFWRLNAHPPEFRPEQVLTLKVQFSGPRYDDERQRRAYVTDLLRTIDWLPGVVASGISTHGDVRSVTVVDGAPPLPPEEVMQRSSVLVSSVSAGSARALGFRLVRGRWFSETESTRSVVVNETLARRDFADSDPIGRRIRVHSDDAPAATIIGVVGDLLYTKLDERLEPEVYVAYDRDAPGRFTAVVRTSVDPRSVMPELRRSVFALDPTLPVFDIQTLEQALAGSVAPQRFNLFVLCVFAAAALGLALTGVYSVMAYAVAQRTQEIGIRMALGADATSVVVMIVRQGATAALSGVAAGIMAAVFLTGLMEQLLFDVRPLDLPTFAIVAAGLMLAAVAASSIPALRAARVPAAETLR